MHTGRIEKSFLAFATALLIFTGSGHGDAQGDALRYEVSPVIDDGRLAALQVTLSFVGDDNGETVLQLPDDWASEKDLWKAVTSLSVKGDGAVMRRTDDFARPLIVHAPGAPITISYRVFQDYDGVPSAGPSLPYRPTIQPAYFHVLGWALIAYPLRGDDRKTPAQIAFADLPSGWSFASDTEHKDRHTLRSVKDSIFVGGDFRILTRHIDEAPVRVALRGKLPFKDTEFAGRLTGIMTANHDFWGDPGEPFLVTVLPLAANPADPDRPMLGGTGLFDAFAFFITDNVKSARIDRVLAHEHLHSWIPDRLGGLPDQSEGADQEITDYWFSEGFTDFYAWRIGVRSGRTTVKETVDALNAVLERYAASPARDIPNTEIQAHFWSDRDVMRLPYDRGMLAALLWDVKIRRHTKGRQNLDTVMRALKAAHEARLAAGRPSLPGARALIVQIQTTTGLDLSGDFERHITNGERIRLPEDLFRTCGTVNDLERPVFDHGYEGEQQKDGTFRVTAVDLEGPAHEAGLRPGMVIDLERSTGQDGTVELDHELRIAGDEDRVIRFRPAGRETYLVQTFVLSENVDAGACGALMGGRLGA